MNAVSHLNAQDGLQVLLRLLIAVLGGGLIGWNRQIEGKPAGLRTHMLVSLGSAIIVMMPLQTNDPPSDEAMSRVIQGVATGVGFLGAGEILHQSRQGDKPVVKGLTSAAAIWTTAALGMTAGCGLWLTSLMGTLLVWAILTWVKRLEQAIGVRTDRD
ncbi:hypothetical protein BST81_07855 [Leptolyngbya sp. 'hensonii']|uniref:MgtC/SapB family protein n=1 Tax=Leptolyngbya sp. 'hensonii' TaxID=1922337 RepID=UPI00094F5CBE|nr:MgtC/SapB family protein [Leptolyngbya sp. 'hensonii']OLP19114.1 hypothetical protein BST81_07855 [Leptolyngbya sp. 'hensonii']